MKVMFKVPVSRLVLPGLLLLAAGSASVAFANADALLALRADSLLASDAPSMLGVIDEHGRTGWACKPEQAAAAKNAAMAELPQVSK
jgi:hypothetical protein